MLSLAVACCKNASTNNNNNNKPGELACQPEFVQAVSGLICIHQTGALMPDIERQAENRLQYLKQQQQQQQQPGKALLGG